MGNNRETNDISYALYEELEVCLGVDSQYISTYHCLCQRELGLFYVVFTSNDLILLIIYEIKSR